MDLTFQLPTKKIVATEIGLACSDETTAITAATNKAVFRMPYDMTLTGLLASVTTAPTGATLIIDVNKDGISVLLSKKLTIAISAKTSISTTPSFAISDPFLPVGAEISIDFDQVGSTIAGAGVKVWLLGTRVA